MKKFILKIWKDPVWSKVIAGFIFAGLASIPITVWWTSIISCVQIIILPFIVSHLPLIIIFLLASVLIVQNAARLLKSNRKSLTWIKKRFEEEDYSISPLFWFPLNGVLETPAARSKYEILKKVSDSRIIKKWIDNKVIKEKWGYGTIYYSITQEMYDFLEEKLKKEILQKKETKSIEILKLFKETPFVQIVLNQIEQSTIIV